MMRNGESKKSDRKNQAVSAGSGLYAIPDDYDLYLMKLSDRNRKLKHLRQKNPEQVCLEKREAGFSIYINGEHSSSQNLKKRDTKTADPKKRREPTPDLDLLRKSQSGRRGWSQDSIAVRTESGAPITIDVPSCSIVSEDYDDDDDFESETTKEDIEEMIESEEEGEEEEESFETAANTQSPSLLYFHSSQNSNIAVTRTLSALSRKTASRNEDKLDDSLNEAADNGQETMSVVSLFKDKNSQQDVESARYHKESLSHHFKHNIDSCSVQKESNFDQQDSLTDQRDSHSDQQESFSDQCNVPSNQNITPLSPPTSSLSPPNFSTLLQRSFPDECAPHHSLPLALLLKRKGLLADESSRPRSEQTASRSNNDMNDTCTSNERKRNTRSAKSSHSFDLEDISTNKEPPPPHSVALDSLFSSKPTSLMMSQHTPGEEDKDESNRRNSPPANNESETTSLPAFLDSNIPAPAAPRLATATLGKGRRQIQCGDDIQWVVSAEGTESSSSLTFISHPPCIECDDLTSQDELRSSNQSRSSDQLRSSDQFNISELRESIQRFDRRRHWNDMASSDQDDILQEFLIKHRETDTNEPKDTPLSFPPPPATSDQFNIPVLPTGSQLTLFINSTWGDRYYVGLTGVEIFDERGNIPSTQDITASPPDINVLSEYNDDPRIASNLLDGINDTRDDLHMWLAPYLPYKDHQIKILFKETVTIAMIRLWNYNKSRIHSYRGVRDIEIYLDELKIFEGEIKRSTGGDIGGAENNSETILFTVDEDVLALIASNDSIYLDTYMYMSSESIKGETIGEGEADEEGTAPYSRPLTSTNQHNDSLEGRPETDPAAVNDNVIVSPILDDTCTGSWNEIIGNSILLRLLSNWGSKDSIGLTEIQLLDSDLYPISLSPSQLSLFDSTPTLTNNGNSSLMNLLNGVTMTTDSEYMWLAGYTGNGIDFKIDLKEDLKLGGVIIWNYNEEMSTGVKLLRVHVNERLVSPLNGFLLRKGPSNDHYDYGQLLKFMLYPHDDTPSHISTHLPCGFVYQMQLLSTWGDQYYVGLTGIEIKDQDDRIIPLLPSNIAAYPESVNVLQPPNSIRDIRTPEKLIDGVIDSHEPQHMWLSPILPGIYNTIYIIFDQPRTLSSVTIWNYGKTPSRGVKEFSILVDDLLIYTGQMMIAPSPSSGILPTVSPPIAPHVVHLNMEHDEALMIQHNDDTVTGTISSVTAVAATKRSPGRPVTAVQCPNSANKFTRRR